MGAFREWLKTRNDKPDQPQFAFSNDGSITVHIRGKKYIYTTDRLYHWEIEKTAKHKPWTAVNMLKDWIQKGWAKQIYPPPQEPVSQEKPLEELPPPRQQTMF